MTKTNNKGFTLVEVIVVAVLLALLAVGLYSFFNLYLRETREATNYLKMQRQAEAFMDDVSREVRRSNRVMQMNPPDNPENSDTWTVVANPQQGNVLICYRYDDDGELVPWRGFSFNGNSVRHIGHPHATTPLTLPLPALNDNAWVQFRIDNDTLALNPPANTNFFRFNQERTEVTVNMGLQRRNGNFNLRFDGRSFRCRVTNEAD